MLNVGKKQNKTITICNHSIWSLQGKPFDRKDITIVSHPTEHHKGLQKSRKVKNDAVIFLTLRLKKTASIQFSITIWIVPKNLWKSRNHFFISINSSLCDKVPYPQLQMSTIGPYLSSPSRSSGGRYHSVITLLVYGRSLSSAWYSRAKPKSASFIWPLQKISRY